MLAPLTAAILAALAPASVAATYNVVDLADLYGDEVFRPFLYLDAMNASGQLLFADTAAGYDARRGVVFDGSMLRDLGTLGGSYSDGFAIDDAGRVVGDSATTDGRMHAFLHDGSTMHDLGTLGGLESRAIDINGGRIVGWANTRDGAYRAYLYEGGVMRDLGTLGGWRSAAFAVNSAGHVAGWSDSLGQTQAFFYDGTSMRGLGTFGGTWSIGTAINDSDWVAGWAEVEGGGSHAFLYDGATMLDLGTLGLGQSAASDINSFGWVVGNAYSVDTFLAFLHRDGLTVDLNSLIDPGSGWRIISASKIDDAGRILGSAINAEGRLRRVLLTPAAVPEPSAFALAATGLAVVAFVRRRSGGA